MRTVRTALAAVALVALVLPGAAEEKRKPRPRTMTGRVSRMEANSLTVTQRGDKGERSETFAVGPKARLWVETAADAEVKGEGGRIRKVPARREGKLAEVKVDQRVTVTFTEPGKADSVLVLRPRPRKEGEKERRR